MHAITDRSPLRPMVLGPQRVTKDDTPTDGTAVPDAAGGHLTAVTYVVITPGGELLTRAADGGVVVDEWDTLYQETLWAAVHAAVDPHRGEVNGVGLAEGMRAKIADAAMADPITEAATGPDPALYPPNPVAAAILTTLGYPPRRWFGTIAIVAAEDDNGITAALTTTQLDIIARAHRSALGR